MNRNKEARIFCTIVDFSYLPIALTLSQSLARFHREKLIILCLDFTVLNSTKFPNIKFMSVNDVGIPDEVIKDIFTYHDVVEAATLLKPFLLEQLLISFSIVTFLDPDTFVLKYIPIASNNDAEGHIGAITPHRLTTHFFTRSLEEDFLKHGIFNLGFIEVNERSSDFLKWWTDRLLWNCSRYPCSPFFTDQKWIDIASVTFNFKVITDASYNVAPWNFDERALEIIDDEVLCQSGPVTFFHFSQGASAYLGGKSAPVWKGNPAINERQLDVVNIMENRYIREVENSIRDSSLMVIERNSGPTKYGFLYRSFLRKRIVSGKKNTLFTRAILLLLVVLDSTRLYSISLMIKGLNLDVERVKKKISRNMKSV